MRAISANDIIFGKYKNKLLHTNEFRRANKNLKAKFILGVYLRIENAGANRLLYCAKRARTHTHYIYTKSHDFTTIMSSSAWVINLPTTTTHFSINLSYLLVAPHSSMLNSLDKHPGNSVTVAGNSLCHNRWIFSNSACLRLMSLYTWKQMKACERKRKLITDLQQFSRPRFNK